MFFIQKWFIYRYIFVVIFFQIIIESFPISSSGHLELLKILNEKFIFFLPESLKNFGINIEFLHLPTIFIILIFFRVELIKILQFTFSRFKNFFNVSVFIFFTTFIPVIFYFAQKYKLIFSLPLYINFFITGLIILSLYFCRDKKTNFWSYRNGIVLGIVQGFALLPGISRFATVFVAACFLGYKSRDAFFLTFLIELPLLVAGVSKGFYTLYMSGNLSNFDLNLLYVIFVASTISYICLIFIQKIIEKNKFWMLSFYMLIPAVVSYLLGV